MNLMIVDSDRKISSSRYVSRYVFTFRLPPCQDSRIVIVIDFPRLQYYGSSKVVIDPWKNHNIVRGFRCSGGDLYRMMGTWFIIVTTRNCNIVREF